MKRDLSKVTNWRMDDVLAATYKGKGAKLESTLTHLVGDLDGGLVVLCNTVKPDSMCNDGGWKPAALTCPACRKRLENAVWSAAHKDYRGRWPDGGKNMLRMSPKTGGTELADMSHFSDAELIERFETDMRINAAKAARKEK